MAEKKPEIAMTACKSKAIIAHGYDAASKTMALQYKGGKVYHYEGVPAEKYAGLQEAESKGGFVAKHITGKHKVRA